MLKKISKEETDIRMVGAELSSLLGIFVRSQGVNSSVTEETKRELANVIKDYCDTIVQYIDLF